MLVCQVNLLEYRDTGRLKEKRRLTEKNHMEVGFSLKYLSRALF